MLIPKPCVGYRNSNNDFPYQCEKKNKKQKTEAVEEALLLLREYLPWTPSPSSSVPRLYLRSDREQRSLGSERKH